MISTGTVGDARACRLLADGADLARGRTVMTFTGDGELRTCAVTPDGAMVIAGEDSGRIHFLRCS